MPYMFLKVKNIIALLYSQKLYTNFKPVWIRYSFTLIHPWNGSHAKHTNKYRKFRWFPLANSKLLYYSALPPIFCIHFHRCCYLSVYMSVCECVCVWCVYMFSHCKAFCFLKWCQRPMSVYNSTVLCWVY